MLFSADHFSLTTPLTPAEVAKRFEPHVASYGAQFTFGLFTDAQFAGAVSAKALVLYPFRGSRHLFPQELTARVEPTQTGSEVHCRIAVPTATRLLYLVAAIAGGMISFCLIFTQIVKALDGTVDWEVVLPLILFPLFISFLVLQSLAPARAERELLRTFVVSTLQATAR